MSVENFIQESFFSGEEAIFASVPTITPIRARKKAVLEPSLPEFRVVRSTRRKRGVTAFRSNGVIEIHMPDRTSRRAERELIPEMIALVLRREAQQRRTDDLLHEIATRLLAQYLPEFHERPSSIRWRSMQGRWGSCTTVDRTIRIAERLASAPEYVLECVILHELIHLHLPGHGSDFHALLERYPDLARAESYLEGFEAGLGAPPEMVTTQELPAR
jgi:predicted metal-dependent hydrolase